MFWKAQTKDVGLSRSENTLCVQSGGFDVCWSDGCCCNSHVCGLAKDFHFAFVTSCGPGLGLDLAQTAPPPPPSEHLKTALNSGASPVFAPSVEKSFHLKCTGHLILEWQLRGCRTFLIENSSLNLGSSSIMHTDRWLNGTREMSWAALQWEIFWVLMASLCHLWWEQVCWLLEGSAQRAIECQDDKNWHSRLFVHY